MKSNLLNLLAFVCAFLLIHSCIFPGGNSSGEKWIAPENVETAGTGFKTFAPDSDIRVFAAEVPEGGWAVRASVPLRKVTDDPVDALASSLDLLDADGSRLNAAFDLFAEDIASLLPVLNDESKPVRSVLYSSPASLEKKTAASLVKNVASLRLRLDAAVAEKVKDKAKEKAQFPDNPTVQSLVAYYGIRSILSQYESAYSKGSSTQCKKLKERMSKIEDAVRDHPKGGRRIANELEDWMDDRIDEIEDRVDDGKKRR